MLLIIYMVFVFISLGIAVGILTAFLYAVVLAGRAISRKVKEKSQRGSSEERLRRKPYFNEMTKSPEGNALTRKQLFLIVLPLLPGLLLVTIYRYPPSWLPGRFISFLTPFPFALFYLLGVWMLYGIPKLDNSVIPINVVTIGLCTSVAAALSYIVVEIL